MVSVLPKLKSSMARDPLGSSSRVLFLNGFLVCEGLYHWSFRPLSIEDELLVMPDVLVSGRMFGL